MRITFCGAARTVTGSSHLIELDNGFRILLDCGLYQGSDDEMENFNKHLLFKASTVDCLVLSHAHIDHTGRVPFLVRSGYKGPIHCTHATRSLCTIMLKDSAMIQERDAHYKNKKLSKHSKKRVTPLYTQEDVQTSLNQMVGHGYGQWFQISKDVKVLYSDAGHILGSASVTLQIEEHGKTHMVGFTGDIGRPNRPILRDPQPMPEVDYLIAESTYGNRDHMGRPDELDKLLRIIKETCLEKKGKLIIPAFSVGRTQEIVYMMDRLETAGRLPRIPVTVDSPLAVNATRVYGVHPECYDMDLNKYLLTDPNPFGFNNLSYNTTVEGSKALNDHQEPAIIISAAGMMNAGRIVHHLSNNIENPKNTLMIVGYCAPHTTGGIIRSGVDKIKLFGEWKEIKSDIEIMDSFSAHADRGEMIDFMDNHKKKVKKLFLVHGEYDTQQAYAERLKQEGYGEIVIPDLGEKFRLD